MLSLESNSEPFGKNWKAVDEIRKRWKVCVIDNEEREIIINRSDFYSSMAYAQQWALYVLMGRIDTRYFLVEQCSTQGCIFCSSNRITLIRLLFKNCSEF